MATESKNLRRANGGMLEQGRRPLLAAVGAGDYAITQVRDQIQELPVRTQTQVGRLRSGLRGRMDRLSPTAVRELVTDCVGQARDVYGGLTERGEQVGGKVLARVRTQPRLRQALDGIAEAFDAVEDTIGDAIRRDGAERTRPDLDGTPPHHPATRTARTSRTTRAGAPGGTRTATRRTTTRRDSTAASTSTNRTAKAVRK